MTEAQALVRLQEIDLDMLRLASTLAAMPQQKKMQAIARARRKVQGELTKIFAQRKDLETYVSENQEDLEHYRARTEEVRAEASSGSHGYRQIQDYEAHLTGLAKKIEKLEHNRARLDEELERVRRAEGNASLTLERLDEEDAAQKKSFETDGAQIRRRIVELDEERKAVVAQVSAEHTSAYEDSRKRFKGLAVERLVGNVPSVCRVKLQPAAFHDLTHGDDVAECPYCHRILIVDDPYAEGGRK
ncbi:MAG: C4-type zinc ribbon domain-containing protein [Coriobacteriaceae bacterium]|nr:C4-type zinc ribbon domain-containing protein [Coriobacteriaceae bacterium]